MGAYGQQVSHAGCTRGIFHLTRCRPVVLRTADPKFAHVGQLWQALYYAPQVRHRISQYRGPLPPEGVTEVDPPTTGIGISPHTTTMLHSFTVPQKDRSGLSTNYLGIWSYPFWR